MTDENVCSAFNHVDVVADAQYLVGALVWQEGIAHKLNHSSPKKLSSSRYTNQCLSLSEPRPKKKENERKYRRGEANKHKRGVGAIGQVETVGVVTLDLILLLGRKEDSGQSDDSKKFVTALVPRKTGFHLA
ncbi:hypothetical protein Sjap_001636 [Stephania japonica]|uniref:Uncharacterized protein n=1 Tax=Stephania japonica TaxID=461633 RepID=A0AAP0KKH0_9MAGN